MFRRPTSFCHCSFHKFIWHIYRYTKRNRKANKAVFLHFKIITTTLHLTYQRLNTAIDSITELDSFLHFVNMQCKVSATKVASYLRERLQCWHIYYNCLEKFHGIRDSCHILKRLLFRSRTYSTNANVPNGTLVPHNLP